MAAELMQKPVTNHRACRYRRRSLQRKRIRRAQGDRLGQHAEKALQIPWAETKMSSRERAFPEVRRADPAAIENQITEKNASQVQAKVMCEGANGQRRGKPTRLLMRKRVYDSDILATPAGVRSATSRVQTGKCFSGGKAK